MPGMLLTACQLDLDATDFVILPPSSIDDNECIQSLRRIKNKCCPKHSTSSPDKTLVPVTNAGIDCLVAGKIDLLFVGCVAGFEFAFNDQLSLASELLLGLGFHQFGVNNSSGIIEWGFQAISPKNLSLGIRRHF